jgi:hypothetical protein
MDKLNIILIILCSLWILLIYAVVRILIAIEDLKEYIEDITYWNKKIKEKEK